MFTTWVTSLFDCGASPVTSVGESTTRIVTDRNCTSVMPSFARQKTTSRQRGLLEGTIKSGATPRLQTHGGILRADLIKTFWW